VVLGDLNKDKQKIDMGMRREKYETPEKALRSVITAPAFVKILKSVVHSKNGADAGYIAREIISNPDTVTNNLGYLFRAGLVKKLEKRGERRNVQPYELNSKVVYQHAVSFSELAPDLETLSPQERECFDYFQKGRPTQEGFMRCFKFNLRTADEKNLDWKTLASIMVESYHQAAHIKTARECGRLKK